MEDKQEIFHRFLKRNYSALSYEEQERLLCSKVLVVGCGGLGGYVLEILARIGVGELIFADGDVFEETNLNRQLLCSLDTLGKNKAEVAEERLKKIAPACSLAPILNYLTLEDVSKIAKDVDVVIDCVGGVSFKRDLLSLSLENHFPLITGAVAGFEGFVCSILSNRRDAPFDFFSSKGAEEDLGCTCPIVSIIGTIQAYEAISYIVWNKFNLEHKILYISLKDFMFSFFKWNEDI